MPTHTRIFAALLLWAASSLSAAETFRVATYNVQNYLDAASGTRPAKSEAAKAKVRESIRATKADVIALQEMGNTNALLELRENLKREAVTFRSGNTSAPQTPTSTSRS